jgi:hypothetical protein
MAAVYQARSNARENLLPIWQKRLLFDWQASSRMIILKAALKKPFFFCL